MIKHLRQWVACCFALLAIQANAGIIGFVDNPSSNTEDFLSFLSNDRGPTEVNRNVNFDAHTTGEFDGNFYQQSDGVRFSFEGDNSTIENGVGPTQSNIFTGPLHSGEGTHAASNYLRDGVGVSTLTISFEQPVFGAGLYVIDYFNVFGNNPLILEAYSGEDGTGELLGTVSTAGLAFNFQQNKQFFFGIGSTDGDIRSIKLVDPTSGAGDAVGLDDLIFAPNDVAFAPTPATALIMLLGIFILFRKARP